MVIPTSDNPNPPSGSPSPDLTPEFLAIFESMTPEMREAIQALHDEGTATTLGARPLVFDVAPAFDPALPEYELAGRLQHVLYGDADGESRLSPLERIREAARLLDDHQKAQHDRYALLSDDGVRRVIAAQELILSCVGPAIGDLYADLTEGRVSDGWAYHELGYLAEGEWNPPAGLIAPKASS